MTKYIIPINSCKLVKGFLRGVIYDLGRNDYQYIDNSFIDGYNDIVYKKIDLDHLPPKITLKMLNYFEEKELIFLSDHEDDLSRFPELNLTYKYPGLLSSAVVFIRANENNNLDPSVVQQLVASGAHYMSWVIDNIVSLDTIIDYLKIAEINGIFELDIILQYTPDYNGAGFEKIRSYGFVKSVLIYDSIENNKFKDVPGIFYTRESLNTALLDKAIDPARFVVGIEPFKEALKYNLFYNGSLYVSGNGNIAIYSDSLRFSEKSVLKESIESIILSEEIQGLWNTPKLAIDVCRICEHRYMCMDAKRAHKRTDGSFYMELECNYNPYIAKWQTETNYLTLIECGVQVNNEEFSINMPKLLDTIRDIWDIDLASS